MVTERGVAVEWYARPDGGLSIRAAHSTSCSSQPIPCSDCMRLEDLVELLPVGSKTPGTWNNRSVFHVFNPSVRLLAEADGVRRTRESLSFSMDPDRGNVSVDVAEIYDAPARSCTRGHLVDLWLTPSLTSSSHRSKSGVSSRSVAAARPARRPSA